MAFIYINLSVSISGSEVYICWVHRGLGFILHIYIIHIYIYYILYIYIYIIIYNLGSSPKIRIPVTLTIDCRGISQETTTLTRNIDQYRTNMNQQTTVKGNNMLPSKGTYFCVQSIMFHCFTWKFDAPGISMLQFFYPVAFTLWYFNIAMEHRHC